MLIKGVCLNCKCATLGHLQFKAERGIKFTASFKLPSGDSVKVQVPRVHHVKAFCSRLCVDMFSRGSSVLERHVISPNTFITRMVKYVETANRAVLDRGEHSDTGRIRVKAAGN